MKKFWNLILISALSYTIQAQDQLNKMIESEVNNSLNTYLDLYKYLHENPEISFMEVKTAERMDKELKSSGFEVTNHFGGNGVVGVFKNGEGPVILVRTDMDALPILEKTELPFASKVIMKDDEGIEVPVMHACGHDMHMSVFTLTAHTLVKLKGQWKGTLIFIAQQAEERGNGAKAMISDGIFKKFPKPDYALAFHVSTDLPAGTIGYKSGPFFASVTSVNVTFKGVGGHGAYPHTTIDPIVMASRAILDYQTIVSRELLATNPAVVTVGSIHGGTKHNIIPDEVKLQLTIRTYSTEVRDHIIEAIKRISKHVALSASMPEDKLPIVEVLTEGISPVINNEELVNKATKSFGSIIGVENLTKVSASMVGEDFGEYGLTEEKIPICISWLGSLNPKQYEESVKKGTKLPALHSPYFYPDTNLTLSTGAKVMTKTVIDLMNE